MLLKIKSSYPPIYLIFAGALIWYSSTVLTNCSQGISDLENVPIKKQYTGTQVCATCHEKEYKEWQLSHHDLAMQKATENTVVGNFSETAFESNGITSRFFKRDGKFFVNTEGPEGEYQDFEIKYAFGVEPLQQYMVEFPGGRLQCLLVAWDTEEKKWFNLQPNERFKPNDWMHWTKGSMTWNTMCADCHSTYLEKDFDEKTDAFDTKWVHIDVSCEACHGPGGKHVKYANSSDYNTGKKVKGSYQYLTKDLSSKEQVDQCARCHSRRGQITEVFDHSGEFMDHYLPEILRPGLYHPDGQILDEVYVYGSFLQSKMYRRNVYCTSCHNPHSLELKFEGNQLCAQCHEPKKYDVFEHHFHKIGTEEAQCISCHMPGKIYMGNDFRRDHSFRVPRPDLSAKFGTPNACNGCHDDKSNEWSARAIRKWYGPDRIEHFADRLAPALAGDLAALPKLMEMIGDTSFPGIAQATAVWLCGEINTQETNQKIKVALNDEDPLIRYTAVNAMERFSTEEKLRFLSPLLKDPVRSVRTQAVYVMADVPERLIVGEKKEIFEKAKAEFQNQLKVQADFPGGQLFRGQYYHKKQDMELAEKCYKEAIRQDPYLSQPYSNLANLYYQQNHFTKAEEMFTKLIEVQPESGDAHYSFGLLLAEMQKMEEAAVHLGKAAELTENPRHYYNWGLTLQNLNRPADAENAYLGGLHIDPNSEGNLYALAVLYLQQQRRSDAEPVVMRLLRVNPNQPEYQQLLRAMK